MSSKHTPNTSEYSKPHSSPAEPKQHVEQLHFGQDGKKDNNLTRDHITDPGAVEMGNETHEWHQQNSSRSTNESTYEAQTWQSGESEDSGK